MKKTFAIKNSLHSLIDKINDEELLEIAYEFLNSGSVRKDGELLKLLSEDERKDLYKSFEASFDESNLLDFEKIKQKHLKWREG